MSNDVRQQLADALNEAERQANACGEGVTWSVDHRMDWATGDGTKPDPDCVAGHCDCCIIEASNGMRIYDEGGHDSVDAAHIARWDPSAVLRLVERDRKMLAEHAWVRGEDGNGYCQRCTPDEELPEPHRWWIPYPCPTVKILAAFWLGTPEADDA